MRRSGAYSESTKVALLVSLLLWVSTAVKAATCPVVLSYDISLGQGGPSSGISGSSGRSAHADIPLFFAQVGIYSNNVGPRSHKL